MAKHQPVLIHEDVTGVDVEGQEITLKQSLPAQMDLFSAFFGEEKEKHSNTIELYDVLPLYVQSRSINRMREHGKYLPTMHRDFKHRGYDYKVSVSPARVVNKNGTEKEFYPSEREEFIEHALRKMCLRKNQGLYLDNLAGVRFYLRELKAELASMGHDMSLDSIIEGLKICGKSSIEVTRTNVKKSLLSAPIFSVLMLNSREDWTKSPETAKCYVQFNPLVTASIQELSFRQFNYIRYMETSNILGRWMFKRMSHNYTNADYMKPYKIKATTIIRDSALQASTFRKGVQMIDAMWDEFKANNIAYNVTKECIYEPSASGQKQLTEVYYTVFPHMAFKSDVVEANQRARTITNAAEK